jgi:hypothetical protein
LKNDIVEVEEDQGIAFGIVGIVDVVIVAALLFLFLLSSSSPLWINRGIVMMCWLYEDCKLTFYEQLLYKNECGSVKIFKRSKRAMLPLLLLLLLLLQFYYDYE